MAAKDDIPPVPTPPADVAPPPAPAAPPPVEPAPAAAAPPPVEAPPAAPAAPPAADAGMPGYQAAPPPPAPGTPPPPPAPQGAPNPYAVPQPHSVAQPQAYGQPGPQPPYGQQGYPGYQQGYAPAAPSGLAITSMVLGIAGVVLSFMLLGFLPSLAAVITGHLASKRQPHAKAMWLTGIITGYIGLAISVITFLFFLLIGFFASTYSG